MRDLHDLINAADLHMLVAPIKLVGLTRSKYLRYERLDVPTPRVKALHMPAHAVHRAHVALDLQRLIQALRGALFRAGSFSSASSH
jgi:hypothetical protein